MEWLRPQRLSPGGDPAALTPVLWPPAPLLPPGQPICTVSTVSAVGPPVHAWGRVTHGAKVVVSGKASGASSSSPAPSRQGDRPLGCRTAADRGGRGHCDAAAVWEAAGLGVQLRRRGEAASPGMRSQLDPARRAAAVLCPGLASLCGRAGAAGGHGPPGQGSSLGHRGVQDTWAVFAQDSPERGRVPGVSSSSSWACRWE